MRCSAARATPRSARPRRSPSSSAAAWRALEIGDPGRYAALAALTALLAGAIGIIGWRLRLGELASFISDLLLSGFKIGAALVIASTQLPKLFGLAAVGDGFFERMIHLAGDLPATHLPSLAVGAGGLAAAGRWRARLAEPPGGARRRPAVDRADVVARPGRCRASRWWARSAAASPSSTSTAADPGRCPCRPPAGRRLLPAGLCRKRLGRAQLRAEARLRGRCRSGDAGAGCRESRRRRRPGLSGRRRPVPIGGERGRRGRSPRPRCWWRPW